MSTNAVTSRHILKLSGAIAIALLALAVLAGSAQAASCPSAGAKQAFSQWGDQRNYVLAPDGGFEAGGVGWSPSGGAAVVEGNESFYLNEPDDSKSLSLPAGSTVISPPICMSIDTPSFRLMARNTGDPTSKLRVEASFKLLGLLRTRVVSNLTAGPTWAPTKSISTVLTLATIIGALIPSAIRIEVTPLDDRGQWQVDDLYIDPFRRH